MFVASMSGLVPEGPLHPGLAAAGLVLGVCVTLVAGPHRRLWAVLAVGSVIALLRGTHGEWPWAAVIDRPTPVWPLVGGACCAAVAAAVRPRRSVAIAVAVAACAGVWTIVPDTEAALVSASVLLGAEFAARTPGWIADTRERANSLVLLLPYLAAVVGSVGRPERMPGALCAGAAGVLTVGSALVAWALVSRWWRQRAGTPTTVASSGTSSVTTAPAPTTAP